MTRDELHPMIRRYRAAQARLAAANSAVDDAHTEFVAAQQELIDAVETFSREVLP